MSGLMTLERFAELAAAYGGDLRRWPEAERNDAARLLEDEPGAAPFLAREAALDHELAAWRAPAGPALPTRLQTDAPRARPAHAPWQLSVGLGLAAACAAGLWFGSFVGSDPRGADPEALITAVSAVEETDWLAESEAVG